MAGHTCSPVKDGSRLEWDAKEVKDTLIRRSRNICSLERLETVNGEAHWENFRGKSVGNLWQECEKWLLDNVGNPWEIVNVSWENQWENIYPRGFLHRNNSVGNPWIKALTHGISHGFYRGKNQFV
ncbi:hypothetical protein Tco_0518273 [Tanacetum coccineum]